MGLSGPLAGRSTSPGPSAASGAALRAGAMLVARLARCAQVLPPVIEPVSDVVGLVGAHAVRVAADARRPDLAPIPGVAQHGGPVAEELAIERLAPGRAAPLASGHGVAPLPVGVLT